MPAKGTAEVKITYTPQLTTQRVGEPEDPPLEGSLFYALPTGEALLYNFEGRATEAAAQPVVEASCRAKKAALVSLPVENWLGVQQKFSIR